MDLNTKIWSTEETRDLTQHVDVLYGRTYEILCRRFGLITIEGESIPVEGHKREMQVQ